MGHRLGVDVPGQPIEIGRFSFLGQTLSPAGKLDCGFVHDHLLAGADRSHSEVDAEFFAKPVAPAFQLIEKGRPDVSRPNQTDRKRLLGEIKPSVCRSQSLGGVRLVDDHGDVSLRGALGDGPYVDTGSGKRPKQIGGDTRPARHGITDDGENRAVIGDFQGLDSPLLLRLEDRFDCRAGQVGLVFGDGEADRVLRAPLGDHHHRDADLAKRTEQTLTDAGDAHHRASLEIEEGDRTDGGKPLDRRIRARLKMNARSRGRRVERVPNVDRNLVPDRRCHCGGMEDLRPEVGKLHCLVVRQLFQDLCVWHESRVGAENTVDISPDRYLHRRKKGGEDRCRVVASVATQSCWRSLRIRRDESCDDQCVGVAARQPPVQIGPGGLPVHSRRQFRGVDDEHLACVHPRHVQSGVG